MKGKSKRVIGSGIQSNRHKDPRGCYSADAKGTTGVEQRSGEGKESWGDRFQRQKSYLTKVYLKNWARGGRSSVTQAGRRKEKKEGEGKGP